MNAGKLDRPLLSTAADGTPSLRCPAESSAAGSFISVAKRFRENSRGFFKAYRWFIALFLLALLCDIGSTIYFMTRMGVEAELNPMILYASLRFGPIIGPAIGAIWKAGACLYVAIYCRKYAVHIFITAIIIYLWAAWYNIWGMSIYKPFILEWTLW